MPDNYKAAFVDRMVGVVKCSRERIVEYGGGLLKRHVMFREI